VQRGRHRAAHQVVQNRHLDARDVCYPLTQLVAGRLAPKGAHLEGLELEGPLGAELVLLDQGLDLAEEIPILQHHDLCVEDLGFLDSSPFQGAVAQILHQLAHGGRGFMQPRDLLRDLGGRHHAARHRRDLPQHEPRRADGDSRRDADPPQPTVVGHASSSSSVR
jgi:hypothetical protein